MNHPIRRTIKGARITNVTGPAETLESWLYSQSMIPAHSSQQTQKSRLRMPRILISRCQVGARASITR